MEVNRRTLDTAEDGRLDEYDKEEWWDVARRVNPKYTREQYEKDWEDFVKLKLSKRLH